MKKILLFSVMLFLATFSFGQDKLAITNLLEKQRLAWNRGDLIGYMDAYWKSDSLVFIGKSGPKYGWKTTLDNYKKSYPDEYAMGILTFNIMEINVIDLKNALVLGGWKLKREDEQPQGFFTLWLRRIKGEWKIVLDHSS
ncbi:YybH family protein [Mucilaginibacter sp.]|uniref:YybH family protein n=1 Tax=Mucilaginibacter sp. TaxID=1882438 RepID=UPI003B00B8C4